MLLKAAMYSRLSRRACRVARLFGAIVVLFAAGPAFAHPHVFARVKVDVAFDATGNPVAVRHVWTFDEMFSAFQTYGLGDGKKPPTREQLAPVARKFIDSMKADRYFTRASIAGNDIALGDPAAYSLELRDGVLELQFTLAIAQTLAHGALALAIYDPSYFVALTLAEKEPARLVDAPANCGIDVRTPEQPKTVDESFFQSLKPDQDWAAQFASAITVTCR